MRYTYLFTQISRVENGNMVPVTDNPHEFVFTFGNQINKVLGKSPDSAKTVLLTKDMWKEYPADNKELLQTVCFSTPSLKGYARPLVMSKEADMRAGVYKYESVGDPIDLKKGQYLSDDIKTLTEIFVKGVRVLNEENMFINCEKLETANIKHLMSYIKSEVYKQLLQDRDNIGKERSEEFLKNVLLTFFSVIPDRIIEKFDKGLVAHDKIRAKLEGVPQGDDDTIKALLKSQGYFKSYDDYKLFVVLRRYILKVKNAFNHFVWIMYRSKIGMVSLKKVKYQLGALFDFVIKVQDECSPLENKDIIKAISSSYPNGKVVEKFLDEILTSFQVHRLDKSHQAALCYKIQEEFHYGWLNNRYKYWDDIYDVIKTRHQEEFRDLLLQYWGINEPNSYKPNKCKKQINEFSEYKKVWEPIRKAPKQFPK